EEGQGGEQLPCTMCGQTGHVSRYCPDQVCEKCDLRGHAAVDCIGCCNCGSLEHFLPDCDRLDHGDMLEPQPESSDDDGGIGDGTF
ncbi:putative nucleotidyltransferase, ribonuclease H, partial [Tanacetum coccineum]